MPALVFFKRKWLIACDDLVIPFAIETIIRLMWLSTTTAITWLKIKNCNESDILNYFLFVTFANLIVSSGISFAISFVSSRGSIMEVEKRKIISKVLYLKLITVIIEIGLASAGIWFFTQLKSTCSIKEIFIQVTTVATVIYICILTVGIIICYDSLGASKYWNRESNSNSLNFFKKAKYIWKLRLKFFCCCADISEENDFIYVEISTFLASFLNGVDLVPTDILAGIITLSHKHALERRHINAQCFPKSEEMLRNKSAPEWMTSENALYFLRIAKSTYGWLNFFNIFRPWSLCKLSPYTSCCSKNSMKVDNCCHANFAAMQKITGFSDSDIIFASFENSLYEPAFCVAVDHNKRYIIIAIRGTRSFSDLVTDIDSDALYFPSENETKYKCHRGVLRSAIYLLEKINEMNLLDVAFNENPSYTLAIAGHSLGGSIAAILGLLLRPKYPYLQCYAYGPMASLSLSGVQDSLDFVFTIILGDDMSPRLSANASKILRKEIVDSLKDCKVPKYRLLIAACWYHFTKYFKLKHEKIAKEVHENKQFENDEEIFPHPVTTEIHEKSNLYAPGRILYFEKNNWWEPIWITGISLQNIIVNPDMIADHQPHNIQFMLEKYAQSIYHIPHPLAE